ncbi:MAG: FtsX-like permease family protein, partial [Bacteroidota bacterium]
VAIQKGAWDQMIDRVVNFYYGYAQVHNQGYWEDRTLDKAFALDEQFLNKSKGIEAVEAVVPRIESFALAAHENFTRGVLVVGTDPEQEDAMTGLRERLVEGEYLTADDQAVLVGRGITDKMKLQLGDTLVMISQGYRGVNAAGKYPIKGIVRFGSPELDKQMVYLPLKAAQYFFGAEDLVTTAVINVGKRDKVQPTVKALKASLDAEQYEVMEWQEMLPELVEAREVDTAGNYVVLMVLYVIIGFGIFGTILMMTKEREYEFGVLTAIGMNRFKLFVTVWLEIIMLGLLGALAGIVVSFPIVYYFNVNPLDFSEMMDGASEIYEKFGFEPIFPAALDPQIFINQAIIVFIITSILAIYPFFKIMKLQPVQAMRS